MKKITLICICYIIFLFLLQIPVYDGDYLCYLLIIVGLLIGFVIAIIVHEFGHLIFGLISGYKFTSFKVLCIKIYKKDKMRICFEKGFLTIPGQCLMKPTNRKYFLYNIGGLIFSYSFSIILLILFYSLSNVYVSQLLFGVFTINTALGVMNSIYNKDGINDICNIVRCSKNNDYLEGVLYQLDIVSNVIINEKFKSKYKPSDDVGDVFSNITIYRLKYYKAYYEGDVDNLERYFMLIKRMYSRINLPILKIPLLTLILNHEFIFNNNITSVKRYINSGDRYMDKLKKFKEDYKMYLFYKEGVLGKEVYDESFFDQFVDFSSKDLLSRLSNKLIIKNKNVYLYYIKNEYNFKK